MIKVLKQTVKALELVSTEFVCNGAHHAKKDRHELGESCPIVEHYEEAIQAGKQAIADLESQEPVALHIGWLVRNSQGKLDLLTELQIDSSLEKYERMHKLYTHPPQRTEQEPQIACNAEVVGYVASQREWVGLTDDEVYKIAFALEGEHWRKIADAIEAKLKELNK